MTQNLITPALSGQPAKGQATFSVRFGTTAWRREEDERSDSRSETAGGFGCPTWIRTRTKASKGPCATVTPSDNPRKTYASTPLAQTEFAPGPQSEILHEKRAHPLMISPPFGCNTCPVM